MSFEVLTEPRPSFRMRWWIILLLIPVISLPAGLIIRSVRERQALQAWKNFKSAAEAKGEDFGSAAWGPAAAPDDQNFAKHPWIVRLTSGEALPAVELSLAIRDLSVLEGYTQPEDGNLWLAANLSAADKVLELTRAVDLAHLREAAALPGCRWPWAITMSDRHPAESCRLGKLRNLLELEAEAALATGDVATAVADLEALLRIGSLQRAQNNFLSLIIGAGMESVAVPLIEAGLRSNAFSLEDRARLLASCRARAITDELARTMRCERGLYLEMISDLEQSVRSKPGPNKAVIGVFTSTEEALARSRLSYCQSIQTVLDNPRKRTEWEQLAASFGREILLKSKSKGDPLAVPALYTTTSVIPQLLENEDRFVSMRKHLAQ